MTALAMSHWPYRQTVKADTPNYESTLSPATPPALLVSCGGGTRKLDEAVFYDGPQFRLKLTRYYENLPLRYTGEVYRVHCASRETRHSPAHTTQDSGWVSIGNGGAIGSRSAAELVEPVRSAYRVIDERTLVWTGNGFNVSFDACGRFRSWYPINLPAELIDPVKKPEWCAPAGLRSWHARRRSGPTERCGSRARTRGETGR